MSLCCTILLQDSILVATDGRKSGTVAGRTVPFFDYDRKIKWISPTSVLFAGGMSIPSENVQSDVFREVGEKSLDFHKTVSCIQKACIEQDADYAHYINDRRDLTTVAAIYAGIFNNRPVCISFTHLDGYKPYIIDEVGNVCFRGFCQDEALQYFLDNYDSNKPLEVMIFDTFKHCATISSKVGGNVEIFSIDNTGIRLKTSMLVSVSNNANYEIGISHKPIMTNHIGNGQIVNAKIGDLSVNTAKIQDSAITSAKISDLAVTNAKIDNLSVDTLKVADYAITTAKIANLAVTNAKIADLSADKITAGTITASISITSPYINGGKIEGGSVISSKFYGPSEDSAYLEIGTGVYSNLGDLNLYRGAGSGGSMPVFSVYDELSSMYLKAGDGMASPTSFLNTTGHTTYPRGTWDFSNANVEGIIVVAKFG